MVFGFFKKKEVEEEEVEIEPVSFLGPTNGEEVNLKANAKLVEAGLMRSKDLVTDALARRADTIRVEPKGAQSVVTVLIDGLPFPAGKLAKPEGLAVTQMMKLLAGLNTKDRKAPQSGAIKAEFDSKPYLLGVNTVPLPEGERLIVRVTDQKVKLEVPQELGMGEELRVKLRGICGEPGMVVVTGPPGSGTTTTFLALVRNVDAYIYTVFTMGDLGGHKLAQATAFEAVMGDDLETTLSRAIRKEANVLVCEPLKDAATTKVLLSKADEVTVLSEMSSKDTPAALLQIAAWAENPNLVAQGLKGILTQKLIRLLCKECKQAYKPKPDFLRKLGLSTDIAALYRKPAESPDPNAESCEACGGIGYRGRTGMFEFLEMSDGMKEVLNKKPDANAIRAQMKKDNMTTLQHDGLRLVSEGLTSLEELQRVFRKRLGNVVFRATRSSAAPAIGSRADDGENAIRLLT